MHFIAPCRAKNQFFDPPSRKEIACNTKIVYCATREENNRTSKKIIFCMLHLILFLFGDQEMDLFAPLEAIKCTLRPASLK